jgi:hypothetical protein
VPIFHHRDESDVAQGPIISGAPFADPTSHTDHRDHEHIVELTQVPTRFEAEVLVAALESRGIKAGAVHTSGHRVLVFESDLDTARAILAENPA